MPSDTAERVAERMTTARVDTTMMKLLLEASKAGVRDEDWPTPAHRAVKQALLDAGLGTLVDEGQRLWEACSMWLREYDHPMPPYFREAFARYHAAVLKATGRTSRLSDAALSALTGDTDA